MSHESRFTTRADHYDLGRPTYPKAAVDRLIDFVPLGPGSIVADLGSGTGILSLPFLDAGVSVIGVEPNDKMRGVAEARFAGRPGFESLPGSAEETGLDDSAVDLTIAGQAFHWFDPARARAETARVLKPGGAAALAWNIRDGGGGAFTRDYEHFLHEWGSGYAGIRGSWAAEDAMAVYFGGPYERATFSNPQRLEWYGILAMMRSSSYTPEPGDASFEGAMSALQRLFERHERSGAVELAYETRLFYRRWT